MHYLTLGFALPPKGSVRVLSVCGTYLPRLGAFACASVSAWNTPAKSVCGTYVLLSTVLRFA